MLFMNVYAKGPRGASSIATQRDNMSPAARAALAGAGRDPNTRPARTGVSRSANRTTGRRATRG